MRKFAVESLEQRRLLAADIAFNAEEGVVIVHGTDEYDRTIVREHRGQLVVRSTAAGETTTRRFSLEEVNSICFFGKYGNDRFVNNSSVKAVAYGNEGNDVLIGGHDADELFGGDGNDRLFGRNGDDELHGDYGNDFLFGGNGNDDVRGWYGDDVLRGGNGDDYVSGYKGNDRLLGGRGDDVLKGHEGDDYLAGGRGDDELYGWKGDDIILGHGGNDYLSGWSGNDILVGGHGHDHLRGHSGRDLLIGGRGADLLDSGSGEDFNVTGRSQYDGNVAALKQILAAWDSDGSVADRAFAITEGTADAPILNHDTITNDNQADSFKDHTDTDDWYLIGPQDIFPL